MNTRVLIALGLLATAAYAQICDNIETASACTAWQQSGYCQVNPPNGDVNGAIFVRTKCQRTCGTCAGAPAPGPAPPTTAAPQASYSGVCQNFYKASTATADADCTSWKNQGFCTTSTITGFVTFMNTFCAAACSGCTRYTCRDTQPKATCQTAVTNQWCNNPLYVAGMRSVCPETCGFCSGIRGQSDTSCEFLLYDELKTAVQMAVFGPSTPIGTTPLAANTGYGNNVWATVVNHAGVVCHVTYSGASSYLQFPASRLDSAVKATTANAYSTKKYAYSTANLYKVVRNNVGGTGALNAAIANTGPQSSFGGACNSAARDPFCGQRIGGLSTLGGGLPLYNPDGDIVGAIGVSGDQACADHIIAWKARNYLYLDYVPEGPTLMYNPPAGTPLADTPKTDNIFYTSTTTAGTTTYAQAPSGHPLCTVPTTAAVSAAIVGLPATRKVA